jgi:DNA (cytosine-5)-methyltransferase 1
MSMLENCASVAIQRKTMKLLSLCTGYGGLDLAVEEFFNAELIGCADIDKASSIAIEHRFSVPNYGDIRNLTQTDLEFDILTAGYPCQPFSHAGQRKGTDDPRHIWPYIAQIISHARPRIVVLENVRGHLSLGFSEVLKDLAKIGYAAKWTIVRASDVGAPHQRARLFILATPDTDSFRFSLVEHQSRKERNQGQSQFELEHLGESTFAHSNDSGRVGHLSRSRGRFDSWGENQRSGNPKHQYQSHDRKMPGLGRRFATRCEMSMQTAPDPLVDGKLSARFVEYMMGLPEGWVTDLPLSRNQQLKMLGNGVVPQQAYYAMELLCRHAF